MFGSFSPPAAKEGDQLVGAVATAAIKAMFQQTESLTAQVRAFPVAKLLMGSLDGFDLKGQGLLMRNGLRVQRMDLKVQALSIDIGAVFAGQIRLRQPTSGTLQVMLTETDLTKAFNTPFIREKLQKMTFEGKPLKFKDTQVQLTDDGQWHLMSAVAVGDGPFEPVKLRATIRLEQGRRIIFADPVYEGDSEPIGSAVIGHINNLMDLDKFSLDGVALRIFRCEVRRGMLTFHGSANIRHFPGPR